MKIHHIDTERLKYVSGSEMVMIHYPWINGNADCTSMVYITFDQETCKVTSIKYKYDTNENLSLEENLEKMEKEFTALNKRLQNANVEYRNDYLKDVYLPNSEFYNLARNKNKLDSDVKYRYEENNLSIYDTVYDNDIWVEVVAYSTDNP